MKQRWRSTGTSLSRVDCYTNSTDWRATPGNPEDSSPATCPRTHTAFAGLTLTLTLGALPLSEGNIRSLAASVVWHWQAADSSDDSNLPHRFTTLSVSRVWSQNDVRLKRDNDGFPMKARRRDDVAFWWDCCVNNVVVTQSLLLAYCAVFVT